jgi:hypothetical protein
MFCKMHVVAHWRQCQGAVQVPNGCTFLLRWEDLGAEHTGRSEEEINAQKPTSVQSENVLN